MASNFDSFNESRMHDFIESELHERDGEGQSEGRLFFGGGFASLNDAPDAVVVEQMGVWNEETEKWEKLAGGGLDSFVNDLCVYKDELIAVGNFTNNAVNTIPNVPLNRIGRYSKKDFLWRDVGGLGNFDRRLNRCFVWNDGSTSGKLIVTGEFRKSNGSVGNTIAQWDGTSWSDLGGGVLPSGIRRVQGLGEFEGELIATGRFETIGNVNIKNIARWNGRRWKSIDAREPLGTVFDAFGDQGNLYIIGNIGSFTNDGPTEDVNGAAFWDGKDWNVMDQGFDGTSGAGRIIRFRGDIIYFGDMDKDKRTGKDLKSVARWDGSTWNDLDGGVAGNFAVGQQAKIFRGQLVVAGTISAVGSAPLEARGIAGWTGGSWFDFNVGTTINAVGVNDGRGVALYESA